jgi:phosphate transport system substrate-binding protein
MKKIFLAISILAISLLGWSAFAGGKVTIKGSDTMVILAQRWAEIYMSKNPEAIIQVTGGGSGTGISALINGTTDICQSSRTMKPAEYSKLKDRFNTPGVEIAVARDGLSVYINDNNSVKQLTLAQLKDIFTGKITSWKDVGGKDAKIILYGRENNSGTYVFFKDNVLKGADYAANTQTMPGTAAVVNSVSKDPNGIGFGGAAYGQGIKYVALSKDGNEYFEPTRENVASDKYPLARNLFFYLRNKPAGEIKAFVDWVLSPEGQDIVTKVGYFPVK